MAKLLRFRIEKDSSMRWMTDVILYVRGSKKHDRPLVCDCLLSQIFAVIEKDECGGWFR